MLQGHYSKLTKGHSMKNIIIAAALALITQSSFALSSLACNAQMLGKTQNAPQTFTAPVLAAQGLNSILKAKHNNDHLFLNFNPQTVAESRGHVILDGRYRHIIMNAHVSIEERNNIISISIRDTETQKTMTKDFDFNSDIVLSFDNGNALFELDCLAN